MGMYDTVIVPCPDCGERAEFQSKGGPCLLNVYPLEQAPPDVLSDVNRHGATVCAKCGCVFHVKLQVLASVARGVPDD